METLAIHALTLGVTGAVLDEAKGVVTLVATWPMLRLAPEVAMVALTAASRTLTTAI